MAISLRVAGTWAELTADGAVAIPATPQAGDRMYLFARWKDFSVTATVANWTELEEFADGSATSGNGTGSVKVGCWYRDWQSGDSNPTIDFSASPTNASVVIMVMQKGADEVWDTPVARTAAMTNWTTTPQSVSASATAEVRSSGAVIGLIGIRDDTATMTRPTNGIDDAGGLVTWNGNYVESPATHHSTTTGDDGAADLGYRLVTTGASGVTLRLTGTISAAETGAALWVVQGVNTLLTPANISVTISGFAPQLQLTLTPVATNLSATQFAPQLQLALTPPAAILSTSGFAPVLNLQITPASSTVTFVSFPAQLREVVIPASVALSMTGFTAKLHEQTTPPAAALSLGSFVPVITQLLLLTVPGTSLSLTANKVHVLPFQVVYLDPGGDTTHAVGHFNQLIAGFGSDVTYDDMQQVAGAGSYRFDSNTNENPAVVVPSVLGPARRVSAYLRFGSVPDAVVTTTRFPPVFAVYSGGGFVDSSFLDQDDGNYATATPAKNAGQGQACSSFGFDSIPVGAAIVSVKIIYEVTLNTIDSIGISRVKFRLNGEEGPDHDDTSEPAVDTVIEADITNDRDWRREDLLDGVFQVIAEARRGDTDTAHTQSWDYVKVQVIYRQDAIFQIVDDVNEPCWHIGLVPRGDHCVLRFADGEGTDYYGITHLFPDADNRICFAYQEHASGLDVNLFVNGIPELSIEDAARGASVSRSAQNLRYGWVNSPGVDHICWFSHLHIDAGDDLQDLGHVLSTAKLPAAVNENNWSTTVGTGAVDERPLSETNHMRHNPATGVRQTYTLQTASAGDVDISSETLIGYMGWAWARTITLAVEGVALVVNGMEFDRTLQLGTTASLLRAPVASTSYPSNAAGIGMTGNIDTADVLMFECGAVVAYMGPANPDILLPRQEVVNETLDTIVDDLRADPPDSYEVCCTASEFEGSVQVDIYSLDQDGGSLQQQPSINLSVGGLSRLRITPGVEVRLDVTVVGATMLTIWRRMNVD